MSWFLEPIINFLHSAANALPLPVFSFFGSLIEEIIAPIPSPLVMILAGALAAIKDSTWIYIGAIILMGALGKTIGGSTLYLIADKGEDIILGRFGKFLGITHREIETIGKRLSKGRRDGLALFLLYATPITPTAPISIICGLVKINLRTYIASTFFGILARNIFYFYLGYTSMGAIESINERIGEWERIGYIILFAIIIVILINIYRKRNKVWNNNTQSQARGKTLRETGPTHAQNYIDMGAFKPNNIKIERQVIAIKNLPQRFNGIRIVHLSDIHSLRFNSREKRVLKIVKELNPDFVFITGDFIHPMLKLIRPIIDRDLTSLSFFWRELGERYQGRVFGVLGNHDNKLAKDCLKMSGVKILDNENQKIWIDKDFINLIGVNDPWAGRDDLPKAMKGIEENIPKILLAHSPDIIDQAVKQKIDLVLVGHTHGEQVKIPFIHHFWMKILSKYGTKYASGLFKVEPTYLYVNRGIGTSVFPIRNSPPEIALIELKK